MFNRYLEFSFMLFNIHRFQNIITILMSNINCILLVYRLDFQRISLTNLLLIITYCYYLHI